MPRSIRVVSSKDRITSANDPRPAPGSEEGFRRVAALPAAEPALPPFANFSGPTYTNVGPVVQPDAPATPPPAPMQFPSDASTVGRWLMDEGAGTIIGDSEPTPANLTFVNDPAWVPDWQGGSAVEFDGGNDEASLIGGASKLEVQPISIEMVISIPGSLQDSSVIMAYSPQGAGTDGRGWFVAYDQTLLQASIGTDTDGGPFVNVAESVTLAPDTPFYVTVTYDGSVLRLYRGGVERASTNHVGNITYTNIGSGTDFKAFMMGRWKDGAGAPIFAGKVNIHAVRISNTARTPAEIAAMQQVLFPTMSPQAEQHIVAGLNFDGVLVGGVSDFSAEHGGFNHSKYFASIDNGLTWTVRTVPTDTAGVLLTTADGRLWKANSDPVLAVSKSGLIYLSNLYILSPTDDERSSTISGGIYVSVAQINNPVFTRENTFKVTNHIPPRDTRFADKQWMAVDNSTSQFSGSVYHAYTRFTARSNAIRFTRSRDNGRTWSSPIKLNLSRHDGAVQGTQVVVGPNGHVHVVWIVSGGFGKRQLWKRRSINGGRTFRAAHPITPVFFAVDLPSTYRDGAFSFPAMAVSPITGVIHVAYCAESTGSTGAQVQYIRATDEISFSRPTLLNDVNLGDQFQVAMHCDEQGRVHACWYDTRNSSNNPRFYDVFATLSLDGGLTWGSNVRVTPIPVDAGTARFIGDYTGITASGGFAHPCWTSGGFNNGLFSTARLTIPTS